MSILQGIEVMPIMKDSGERQQFEGGAQRDTATGKPQFSLLSPVLWTNIGPDNIGCYVRDYLLTGDIMYMNLLLDRLYERMGGEDRLLEWLRQGAAKYSRFNWALGLPVSRCLDSLGRHLRAVKAGKQDEDHEAASACNTMFIIHYHEMIRTGRLDPKWNDRFDFNLYKPEKKDA